MGREAKERVEGEEKSERDNSEEKYGREEALPSQAKLRTVCGYRGDLRSALLNAIPDPPAATA